MHQKAFGGQDPLGSLSAPPDPLAAIWGLLLKGGGGEGKGRKEGSNFFVQVYAPASIYRHNDISSIGILPSGIS